MPSPASCFQQAIYVSTIRVTCPAHHFPLNHHHHLSPPHLTPGGSYRPVQPKAFRVSKSVERHLVGNLARVFDPLRRPLAVHGNTNTYS